MESSSLPTIMMRPKEGRTLVYNYTAHLQETWYLTRCSSHPTHSKRNQHLCYPEGIAQSQQLEPWSSQFFAKWTGQRGGLASLGVCVCLFFKQIETWEGEILLERGRTTTKMRSSLASGHAQPTWPPLILKTLSLFTTPLPYRLTHT